MNNIWPYVNYFLRLLVIHDVLRETCKSINVFRVEN